MAILSVLDKQGKLLNYPVVEDIETIYNNIYGGDNGTMMNPRPVEYLKLTDLETGKLMIIQTRYIYLIK